MPTLRCHRCAHAFPLREGQSFCPGCGTRVAAPCPGCSRDALWGDRHCGFCGVALAGAAAATGPAAVAMPPEGAEFAELARAARARASAAEHELAPPTKAHLDQADLDQLFS